MTAAITPLTTANPEGAPPLPPLAVEIGEAYDLAVTENQGHDILVEKGLADLGGTYLSYEGKDGEVTYATVREAMLVCSHLPRLSNRLLGVMVEEERLDPKQIPGYARNLPQLDA